MINTELDHKPITKVLDELSIEESFEPHKILVTSSKRSEKIQILPVDNRHGFFKVLYESGKPVPNIEGSFTSAYGALQKVKAFLINTKATDAAVYKERWGDKPIPKLETKQKIRKVKEENNDAISESGTQNSN